VQELPYTPTGKLMKTKLRQEFSAWEWDKEVAPTAAAGA
jgi:acyl-coenzyme A synthetase/AMP-(fatty) acid ligase